MTKTGLAIERQAQERALLKQRRVVTVEELCEDLGVSAATVRRDLADLEQRGQLRRVHGGAVAIGGRLDEVEFEDKASIAAAEKKGIARAARGLVKTSDSIFLDGGSTVLALANLLTDESQLTVVTNSLRVAGTFSGQGPRTILVGGELRRLSQTFVGPLTQPMIEQLHVDVAFMGTIGLSAEEGLTTTDPHEALTKELVMAHAGQVVLLADSQKIGKISFVHFGDLDRVDVLITDKGISDQDARRFRKKGIKVVVG